MGCAKVLGQRYVCAGLREVQGERGVERRRWCKMRRDRQVLEFCLYPQKNEKPLQSLKPDNDTVRFPFLKDRFHSRMGSRLERGRTGGGGQVRDYCQDSDEQIWSPRVR